MSEPETSCPSCSFHMRVCEGEREGKGKREREMVSRCCLSGVTHPFQSLLTTECSMDGAQSVHTHTHTHTHALNVTGVDVEAYAGANLSRRAHTPTHTHRRASNTSALLHTLLTLCSLLPEMARRSAGRVGAYITSFAHRSICRTTTCQVFLFTPATMAENRDTLRRFCSVNTFRRRGGEDAL